MKLDEKLIKKLEERYQKYWWSEKEEKEYRQIEKDKFKLLVFTILSQNTSSRNAWKAYRNLAKNFDITPQTLADSNENEIAEAIKEGGLYRVKARAIKRIAKIILEKYNGSMEWVNSSDAREKLIKLPGVGNKTADVIMASLKGQRQYFVIDTHMRRIAMRLGIVDKKAGYEEIQHSLKEIIPWDKIKGKENKIVSLLWLLAKYTCRAKNPICRECILSEICRKNIQDKL